MITSVIEQLRCCLPEFKGEVYGISDLKDFLPEIVENKPSLYVSHFSQALTTSGRNQILDIKHDFKVFGVIPISHSDHRGESAHDQLICLRDRLLQCLWGFKPLKFAGSNECPAYKHGGLSFTDSQLVQKHHNMLIQVYSFEIIEQLSKASILSNQSEPLTLTFNVATKIGN